MAITVPFLYWFMPDIVALAFGEEYRPASDAARLMLLAGAVGLVFAWTKSLPVSVGRPELRIVTHGIETVVLIPLVLILGELLGRDRGGGGRADLDLRLRPRVGGRGRAPAPGAGDDRGRRLAVKVVIVSGIWPPDVGGPASHAPELADFLHGRGHEVRVVTTADAAPAPRPYPVDWTARGATRRVCAISSGRGSCTGRQRVPTSSTRPGCSGAARSARGSPACRSSSASQATRPTSARCGAG